MQEITGNLWQLDSWKDVKGEFIPVEKNAPLWLCVTTNGEVKKSDGKAVMGAGIAKEARDRYKGVDEILAKKLNDRGNQVSYLCDLPELGSKARLLSFPTKEKWRESSCLKLIETSAKELKAQFLRAASHYCSEGMNDLMGECDRNDHAQEKLLMEASAPDQHPLKKEETPDDERQVKYRQISEQISTDVR
jgi:hypothetical protein